jgi:hypothetical protein
MNFLPHDATVNCAIYQSHLGYVKTKYSDTTANEDNSFRSHIR